jgi:hypothetical protein
MHISNMGAADRFAKKAICYDWHFRLTGLPMTPSKILLLRVSAGAGHMRAD